MTPNKTTSPGTTIDPRIDPALPHSETSAEAPLQPSGQFSDTKDALKRDAGSAAASLTEDVKQAAKAAQKAVGQQASDFMGQVGQELGKTADRQKLQGAEAIAGLAHAVSTAAAELEAQSPQAARYVRDAAEKIDLFSSNLRNRNVDDLLRALSDLARSQPALFMGGAVAVGFAVARFVKSSAQRSSHSPSQPQ
jgi:hypothetical protein